VDTTQRGNDAGNDLAALDFGDESGFDSGTALDFGDECGDNIAGQSDKEFSWELTTVTNPAETVSVTAIMDGSIQSVELAADAGSMTESELEDEILVIADLASQQASSILHTLLIEGMKAQGIDDGGAFADILGDGFLNLSSPKQAVEAQAEVFATRYASNHD
jgi:hypothetical protein